MTGDDFALLEPVDFAKARVIRRARARLGNRQNRRRAVRGCDHWSRRVGGFPILLGTDRAATETMMQIEGSALQITTDLLRDAVFVQAAFTTHANGQGTIGERLELALDGMYLTQCAAPA